jgi:transposase
MRQEILTGPERRRRWSVDQKLAILREAGGTGVRVSDVARRHDITRQHIYQWRSALRSGRLGDGGDAGFLPVELVAAGGVVLSEGSGGSDFQLEVLLSNGRCLRMPGSVSTVQLARLIRAVEGA